MMKRWMAMGMALCLTAASLAGCSGTKDAAESTQAEAETSAEEETAKESDLDKLTFTYVTSPLNVPTIIEKNQGIFEKTFGDMGIEVDYAELTSGADQTQALASGDVQVLYAVGGTSVILSAANGADIKVLNMYSRSPKAFCMYSKDESLTTPESLRGKTIAGPTGTNLHELLVSYLATAGMTIDDVNYVNMSIPDAKAGLDGGSVDVALVAGATAYNAGQQGYHLVADGEGLIKAIIAVAVTQKFYDEHPEIIEKLEEVSKLDMNKDIRLYSQTTKSLDEFRQIVSYIETHISPEASFQYFDTICRQVANRMPHIREFAASHDLVFFVCGHKSSNGKILFQECKKVNPNSYQIDKPEEIDKALLSHAHSIGICGATSTPKWLMEACKKVIMDE